MNKLTKENQDKPKNKLILTMGPPASGKSTWTRQLLEANPYDYVQVELDQMRAEWGVPLKETPKDMLQERDKRVLEALRAGKTVIASDTNLTAKARRRLESLANQAHVPFEINDSFLNTPIDVCIERDAQREGGKRVGKEVIMAMYARYRDNLPVKQEKALVIGDVHGEHNKLLSILKRVGIEKVGEEWVNPHDYKIIFLGDLNDHRLSEEEARVIEPSSWKSLCIAKELSDLGWAVLIQSNHQINLIDWYEGHRKKLNYGLDTTVQEIKTLLEQGLEEEVHNLIYWLKGIPYYYQFLDSNNQLYTCSHATFTPGMSQFHPSGQERADAIYGMKENEERFKWWEDEEGLAKQDNDNTGILISGHYHEAGAFYDINGQLKAILLDGGAGFDNGTLYGLDINKEVKLIWNNPQERTSILLTSNS